MNRRGLLALVLIAAGTVHAQNFPTRPIRWVVPFAAGGGADVVGRPVALAMGELLGQPIVYDNRGGGNGMIAGEIVARAAPDGYTLLLGGPAILTANPHLYRKMPFDVERDFVPITKIAGAPNVMGAHPGLPARNVQELIDYAKTNPNKINWASSGIGTGGHIAVELFMMRTGTKVTHISFKGAGPALVSLMAGDVQLLVAVPGVFLQHLKTGRVRALATTGKTRFEHLPDLPTVAETVPGYDMRGWYGFVAPAAVPRDIITLLNAEINRATSLPDVREKLVQAGLDIPAESPEYFADLIKRESAKFAKLVRDAGLTPQ